MKKIFTPILIVAFFAASGQPYHQDDNTNPVAPYAVNDSLMQPALFATGVITTDDDEFGGTFTPDGQTCYFSKSVLRFYIDVICLSHFKNGK
jgi:hypothetical protein